MDKNNIPDLPIIGSNVKVDIADHKKIPAKIDTGAEFSAVWASNVIITPENHLVFSLFAPESPFYTGERIEVADFAARTVRNSTGHEQIRYRVQLPVRIQGRKIRMNFTLADRSRNNFPILIGRRAIMGKFLVDVSKVNIRTEKKTVDLSLNDELKSDPQAFHQKYIAKTSPEK